MKAYRNHTQRPQSRTWTSTVVPTHGVMATSPYELPPAAVLPEQFYENATGAVSTSGAVALVRAILDDAIACYQKQFESDGRRAHRLAAEAEAWLFSDEDTWPFTFVNVCAALGIEPDFLRRQLRHAPQVQAKNARAKVRHTAPVRKATRIAA